MAQNRDLASKGTDKTSGSKDQRVISGKYHLVVIALDKYKNDGFNLANPILDAERIIKLLTTEFGFLKEDGTCIGFTEKNTKRFFNEEADEDKIVKWLKNDSGIQKNDALLIYFAGHGIEEDENLHLCLYDFDKKSNKTYFSVSSLYSKFKSSQKCRDILIILDCCYAGNAANGFGKNGGGAFCRKVLMSSSNTQKASDGLPAAGSPFANALLDCLRYKVNAVFSIDDILGELRDRTKAKLDVMRHGTGDAQDITLAGLPETESGSGSFWFQRSEPFVKPALLQSSIINYFNFERQRSATRLYNRKKNQFNIISCTSRGQEAQKLLARWFFLTFFKNQNQSGIVLNENSFVKASYLGVNSPDNIWNDLINDSKVKSAFSSDKSSDALSADDLVLAFLKFMADRPEKESAQMADRQKAEAADLEERQKKEAAMTDNHKKEAVELAARHKKEKADLADRHKKEAAEDALFILWLDMGETTRAALQTASQFCAELIEKLGQKINEWDEKTDSAKKIWLQNHLKVFIFLSDIREGDEKWMKSDWFQPAFLQQTNIIVADPIETVTEIVITNWLDKEDNIKKMDHPDFKDLKNCTWFEQNVEEYIIEQFIEHLSEFIKYPDHIADQFITALYNLDNPKIY